MKVTGTELSLVNVSLEFLDMLDFINDVLHYYYSLNKIKKLATKDYCISFL